MMSQNATTFGGIVDLETESSIAFVDLVERHVRLYSEILQQHGNGDKKTVAINHTGD
jgi:hypothetical protein